MHPAGCGGPVRGLTAGTPLSPSPPGEEQSSCQTLKAPRRPNLYCPSLGTKSPRWESSGGWGAHLSNPPAPFPDSPSSTLFSGVLALSLRGRSGPFPVLRREYLADSQITTFPFAHASDHVLYPLDIKFNDSLKKNPSTG